jgi:hypothetical protein
MKSEIHELRTDLKAAVSIGHPESIQVGLDGYRALPEVAGNAALSQAFLEQAVLPLGEVLAYPNLDVEQLNVLLNDSLAGVRALSAVALAVRFLAGQGVAADDLFQPARDQRTEVRIALGETLARNAGQDPQRLLALLRDWFGVGVTSKQSRRVRLSALIALRGLIPDHGEAAVTLLSALPKKDDRQVRAAHVETLIFAAERGHKTEVYELLASWGAAAEPDTWMIVKPLSAAWAASDIEQSEAILLALEERVGEDRAIERAKRALVRHRGNS